MRVHEWNHRADSDRIAALEKELAEAKWHTGRMLEENATLADECIALSKEKDSLRQQLQEAKAEVERMNAKATEYHRRAQQAEAACVKFKSDWDKNGGPCGGNFGRAILASAYRQIEEDRDFLAQRLKAWKECAEGLLSIVAARHTDPEAQHTIAAFDRLNAEEQKP